MIEGLFAWFLEVVLEKLLKLIKSMIKKLKKLKDRLRYKKQ